jgi:hypothetical protein
MPFTTGHIASSVTPISSSDSEAAVQPNLGTQATAVFAGSIFIKQQQQAVQWLLPWHIAVCVAQGQPFRGCEGKLLWQTPVLWRCLSHACHLRCSGSFAPSFYLAGSG